MRARSTSSTSGKATAGQPTATRTTPPTSIASASERGRSPGPAKVDAKNSAGPDSSSSFATSSPSPSRSGKKYRKLLKMNPYDGIPNTRPSAADSAEKLYSSISKAFPGVVTDFEAKWKAWQTTWFPTNSPSFSASDCCQVPEFDNLVALGPKIVPLVVYKLASTSENFIAVNLYNELEKDKDYLVDPNDVLNYNVLQRQANLIVDINYERNKLVQARIEAWEAHCTQSHVHSNSGMYTECDDYARLLELGGSIIAHLMLAYAKDPSGFWFELLHETVHGLGKKTGLRTIDFKEQYAAWNEWFQKGEHDEAPWWSNGIRAVAE